MTNPTVIEHNVVTGEIIEREMTKAEADARTKQEAEALANEAKAAAGKAALLEKLGITEDEARLLLG
jgi:hypothetical protein